MSESNKLLVFHTEVAPYRVDFFNYLAEKYDMFLCMDMKVVYGGLYIDINKSYRFRYSEMLSTKGIVNTYREVKKNIKNHQPDIVMVSECGLISMLVILYKMFHRSKFKIVSIVDDSFDQLTEGRQFTKKHELGEKVMMPYFDQVINVDERVASFFQSRYGKGVSFPIIRNENIYREKLKEALPISCEYVEQYGLAGTKVVLYVGRFVKIKNIPSLISAFQKVGDESCRLVLVGGGEEEPVIREMVTNEKRIILTGSLSGNALYAWYNIANVFVLASYKEPFGAVTNEALMAGCMCLITERAGSSSLIVDGENGYCFDPLNNREMEEKLKKLLDKTGAVADCPAVRPCLMQTTFQEEIDKVINAL